MPESYVLVNSPAPAPLGILSADRLTQIMSDSACKKLFDEFIAEHGPFDVIHFQTLEGISPNVLSLKEKYPQTKFIHTIHDYGLFCPNVRFWKAGGTNCVRNQCQEDCRSCMISTEFIPLKEYLLNRVGISSFWLKQKMRLLWKLNRFSAKQLKPTSLIAKYNSIYLEYRKHCVELINQYIDVELAVSKRVKEIAIQYGVNPNKVEVNYIGTKVAENAKAASAYLVENDSLTILYMGYAAPEKGFGFLVTALRELNPDVASKVTLKFASRMTPSTRDELYCLRTRFKDVIVYNGYSHADFPKIFKGVNMGVVPPLWEDNLPQVAIEMVANGIPVMTSKNGGAQELNSHPCFVFKDKNEFLENLEQIFRNPSLLREYWNHSTKLTTMEEHINRLIEIYSK